jgi:hypothetical protein
MNIRRPTEIEAEHSRVSGELMPIIDKENILNYAEIHYVSHKEHGRWNGRQIRNAFLTAAGLARYEFHDKQSNPVAKSSAKYEITARHFEKVAEAGAGFDYYLQQAKGKSDSELAYDHGIRADQLTKTIQPRQSQAHQEHEQYPPRGYQQPGAYDDPYRDQCQGMNRGQASPALDHPGHYRDDVPIHGSQRTDPRYRHVDSCESYDQSHDTLPRFGRDPRNEEVGLAASGSVYPQQLTPRPRTPQPAYTAPRPNPGYDAGFSGQYPNDPSDDFD